MRIPGSKDWDKSLKSVVSKAKTKFKLNDMDDTEWALSINGAKIDKTDSVCFQQALCALPPVPIVEIVQVIQEVSLMHLLGHA